MDASILTTFFCFILLVLNIVLFIQFRDLTIHVNAHMDRTDLHSEQLRTCLSILQQLESKVDLIFSNSPPVPGEVLPSLPVVVAQEDWSQCRWVNAPSEPQPELDNAELPAKKRGRPRKTPITNID